MNPMAEEEQPGAFSLTHEHVIRVQKWVWVPVQKVEQGITWLRLDKWDRSLNRFCTGKSLDLRAEKSTASIDGEVYSELMRCRQEAFDVALSERLQHEDSQEPEEDRPKKKVRKAKAVKASASKHKHHAPHHIMVKVPATEEIGVIPEFRMLFEGLGSTTIWIELTEEVLVYLKIALGPKRT